MGSKVSVPGPTPEERDLQRNQAELLALQRQIIEEQRAQNRIILPFLAAQEGFDVTTDDNGNITGITQRAEETAKRAQEAEITRLLGERSLAALRGELPVDPALEKDLQTQEQELKNQLTTQFGPGYETSTPGIQALEEFRRTSEILRSGARTGQLTLAEQLGITREQQAQFSRQSSGDVLRTSAIGDPLTFAGAFGQTARGYGQAQIPFIQQRQMQLQASIANAQSSAGLLGAGIGAIGAFFSDEEGKLDPVAVSETLDGITIYEYTHAATGERMIGVMAGDVEKVRPGAVYNRMGYRAVNYRELR
jgi:hypothetical protein